jgi:uncharacterized OsmC-like protein
MASQLRVDRTGTRQGVARNGRGASVRFGPEDVDGSFTPGELLALALAACNVMSADHVLVRRLGEVGLTATVETTKDVAENAYVDAHVELAVAGGTALDDGAWNELVAVVSRAVERSCTVGRTLDATMPHSVGVVRAQAQEESS